MKAITMSALAIVLLAAAAQASAQVTFYEDQSFQGRSFTTGKKINELSRSGFNDRASSATVKTERWEVCEDAGFRGNCVVLRPGQYPTLSSMGLNDRIASVRAISRNKRVEEGRYAPLPTPAKITFYENENFGGRSFVSDTGVDNFDSKGFNDRISSIVVTGPDQWEACEDVHLYGRCVVLRAGRYPTLGEAGLNDRISSVRNTAVKLPAPAPAQVTFFENEGFAGRSFSTKKPSENFQSSGFNDRASSLVVAGDQRWEVCEDAQFKGRCMVLRPGQYSSLTALGLNNRVSSVRDIRRDEHIEDWRYASEPVAAPDYRQRKNELLYVVNVNSVKAVVGTPDKRCWVESGQVPQEQPKASIPGAVVGALLGGILGHQVGGGTGKDIATAGGAIAGAVIGYKVGGNIGTPQAPAQDVQRCEDVPSQARTEYWDVTYTFKGLEHRVQMTTQPGRTITVNEQGEPRT